MSVSSPVGVEKRLCPASRASLQFVQADFLREHIDWLGNL
jgi:hypothetical protein